MAGYKALYIAIVQGTDNEQEFFFLAATSKKAALRGISLDPGEELISLLKFKGNAAIAIAHLCLIDVDGDESFSLEFLGILQEVFLSGLLLGRKEETKK
jgi:hypothetical protein